MTSKEIKKLRKKLNLNQEDFAQKVGVTVTTISRWERGKSKSKTKAVLERLKEIKEMNRDRDDHFDDPNTEFDDHENDR